MKLWLDRLGRLAEAVSTLMFAAIFVLFLAAVIARYAFSAPIIWADEMCMILMLWQVFLADAFVSREQDHIAFDMLYDLVGDRGKRNLGLAGSLLFGVIFAIATPQVWDYILFLWRERTAALQWRLDFVFSCFAIYFTAVVVRLAIKFVRLCRPDWRKHIIAAEPGATNLIG
jgi:TRAP-type C4-dicarboxylate transport system permease small subunit